MFRSRSPMVRKTDKMTSFITVLWRYVLFSSIFWVLFSIICFILLYNPEYGEKSRLYFFSSWHLSTIFILIILGIIIFSAILGAVISIPSIILKIAMKIRVEKKSRKGQKPVILIYSSKYLPILFCISSHIFALLISTSSAPQLMRNWFRNDFKIYKMQQKIYKELFDIKTSQIYSKWRSVSKDFDKESKFIFILPQKLLMYKDSFKETKSILTKENNWLLYSQSKEAITASILDEVYFADERLFLPAPMQSHHENYNETYGKKNMKTKNFIGVNGKNLLNFNNIFQKDSLNNLLHSTWFTIFLNRVALSQPQLLFFYRVGFITPIFPAWKWDNLTNSNNYLLLSYINKLINIDKKKENFLFFLTEMEDGNEYGFLHSIEWPNNITKDEFEKNIQNIDNYLATAIKALKDGGHDNILVIPYSQKENYIEFGKGFSNSNFQDQLLNTEIINQQFIKNTLISNCNPIAINYNLNNLKHENHQINYFLLDTINSKNDQFPNIKQDFLLAIKNKIRYGVLCQSAKKSTYITFKKDDLFNSNSNFVKINYKNINYQLFNPYDKKPKKNDSESSQATKTIKNDNNLNEFFRQFDIYKVNSDPNLPYINLTDLERDQFIKVYGNEVKNKFFSYINFSIK